MKCSKCLSLCNKDSINILNDGKYCVVPPCSIMFKEYTLKKYFLAGAVDTLPENGDKFNTLSDCVNYMIDNYNLSLETFLKLSKVLATS